MRTRGLLVCIVLVGCGEPSAPPRPDVRVKSTPPLVASFASLGGTHTLSAEVTDTLGGARTDVPIWDVLPASRGVTVVEGTVTVSTTAPPGDYRVRATVLGVSDTTIVSILPRPSGKLVFTALVGVDRQVFVKDFASDGDAVQVTTGASASGGLAVDQATGTVVVSRGTLPNVDLFRMHIDGSGLVNLTNDALASNQGPAFNTVTGQIFFSRRGLGGTTTQIFRMTANGSSLTEVTTGTQGKVQPSVSPNGLLLSWTEQFPGFNQEIVTSSITGESPQRFTDRAGVDGSSFWISNTRLAWGGAVTTAPDIFVADAPGGSNAINLTNRDGASLQPSAGCSPGTITILRRVGTESAVYQFDLTTALAVKYTLPVSRDISFPRRLC